MRLLRVLSLLPALLLLAAPLEAEARERVMVQKALSLKEVGSGQSQFYPGRAGYGY